jgi:hypothetical protein
LTAARLTSYRLRPYQTLPNFWRESVFLMV